MAEREKIMKILFASGDIGGARALLPIMRCCEKASTPFSVLANGHILSEIPGKWNTVRLSELSDIPKIRDYYQKNNIGVLVFSSSVKDSSPLWLARWTKNIGIPVIHVLDSWSQYRQRMEMGSWPALKPDVYTVMYDLAYNEARKNGIDPSSLKITGQPALSHLLEEFHQFQQKNALSSHHSVFPNKGKKFILFISEPVRSDQGKDDSFPFFRGYTEKNVIEHFLHSAQPFSEHLYIGILPHPREEKDSLENIWQNHRGNLQGRILNPIHARQSLFHADGIAGMASIMLYEGWLLGKPVISLQPDLRLEPLRMFEKRKGISFVDSWHSFTNALIKWVESIPSEKKMLCRPDMALHKKAPENVFAIIENILEKGASGIDAQPRRAL
jgi:hypothetical protein